MELFVNDNFVLHSIYKLYGIPLIAFLLAIGLGQFILPDPMERRDLYIFIFGALSLVVSYFILRTVDKKHANEAQPKMVRIL